MYTTKPKERKRVQVLLVDLRLTGFFFFFLHVNVFVLGIWESSGVLVTSSKVDIVRLNATHGCYFKSLCT